MPDEHRHGDVPANPLRQMIAAYQVSQAIHVAAVLGLADHLGDGPRDSDWLAQATGAHEGGLCRLLRGLASVGIFAEVAPKRFALTPMAEPLRKAYPGSVHALAVLHGQDWMWRPWGRLRDSVMTGRTAFDEVFGIRFFEHFQRDPAAGAIFQAAMPASNIPAAVVEAYDFSRATTVADIGGGLGGLLAAILGGGPHLRGILFERPGVIGQAGEHLAAAGVDDRCELVTGDFVDSVCAGADVYLLSQILHDWDDTTAVSILANCRRAMGGAGTLLIVERIASHGGPPRPGPLTDLIMLVMLGGQERTREEYAALLDKADFRLTRVIDTPQGWNLIEAVPAGV